MTQKTTPVPDELLRELKRQWEGKAATPGTLLEKLLSKLPDPPKPDVVEECSSTFARTGNGHAHCCHDNMKAALRRYRELRGLPPDPELEGE